MKCIGVNILNYDYIKTINNNERVLILLSQNTIEHMFTLSPTPVFYIERNGADAMMIELFDQYVVLDGSCITPYETRGCPTNVITSRRDASKSQSLVDNEVVKPIFFRSPSAASGFVLGRATNGWKEWRTSNGVTLDERTRAASMQ